VVPVIVAVKGVVEQVRTPVGVGVTLTVIVSPPFEQAVATAMTNAPTKGRR
jgi:hypothetical protein